MSTLSTIISTNDIHAQNLRDIVLINFFAHQIDSIYLFVNHLLVLEGEFIPRLQDLHEDVVAIYNNMHQFHHGLTRLPYIINNLSFDEMLERYDAVRMLRDNTYNLHSSLLDLGDLVDEMEYLIPDDALRLYDRDVNLAERAIFVMDRYLQQLRIGMDSISSNLH